jgi:hypothetical protein
MYFLKPELELRRQKVAHAIVVFGSTRICEPAEARRKRDAAQEALDAAAPTDRLVLARKLAAAERILAKSHYYDVAREFGQLVGEGNHGAPHPTTLIMTGGGPGIMEAANRGASEVQAKSAGLNILLPQEQMPNPYITPELCFQFRYFAMRKFHFLLRARALVVFPGGYGTLDELFDALALRQTKRMQDIPIILFDRQYWSQAINFQFLADEGAIDDDDLDLFRYADTAEQAWDMIQRFHKRYGTDERKDY